VEDKIPPGAAAGDFRRSALREFLRARRRALTPQMVGLPPRRRWGDPGLRLQDVAELCGVSTGWITTLELGAAKNISPFRLAAIASALRLDDTETAYLFHLTGTPQPARAIAPGTEAPVPLRHLVESYSDGMALLLDRRYDILASNEIARAIGIAGDGEGFAGNLIWRTFLIPECRRLSCHWRDAQAGHMTATLRRLYAESACDERLEALIHELLEQSEEFARNWQGQSVEESNSRRLNFLLPSEATISVGTVVLTAAEGLRTIFFVPSDDVSRRNLLECARAPKPLYRASAQTTRRRGARTRDTAGSSE
jgi:transcriptional regulator with XRE-family HTH domain